jgi:chemotaxis protein MotA
MADDTTIYIPPPSTGLDLATIIGLVCGFGLVSTAIYLGGSPGSFINIPSVLIVIGGTLAVTTMCYSIPEMARTIGTVTKALYYSRREVRDAAFQVLQLAEISRRKGVLALQPMVNMLGREPFLQKGLSMAIDGTPGEEVEAIMRRNLQATTQRHHKSANVLRRMAEFSPAMGLIGTLIGLVQMLGNLQDPANIGPSMAVALLTTFYGAVLANMVFMPLAAKLERNSSEETLISTIYMMGASSVGRQENPRRLENLINSIVSPEDRIQYFD